jgi:autotransporter-associated beta strand protein
LALAAAAGLAGVAGFSRFARADVYGNNGGTALDQSASWVDETTAPTPGTVPGVADIAQWDSLGAGGGPFNLNAPTTWLGISIINPAAAVTIGGGADAANTLTLGGSGINMSAATQNLTISDPLALSTNQTWSVASGQTLTVTSTTTTAVALTVGGSGNTVFGTTSTTATSTPSTAVITGSGGSLTKNGTGTLTLSAINNYNGGTTVNNGTLVLNMAGAATLGAANANLNLLSGTLNLAGGSVLTAGGQRLSGSAGNFAYVTTISTLNVAAGDNSMTESRGSSARTIDVFSNVTRSVGATVSFTDPLNANGTNNGNGGGYRMKNATDGNALVINGVIPFATYSTSSTVTSFYAPSTTSPGTSNNGTAYNAFVVTSTGTLTATSNVSVDSSPTFTGQTVNTLYFNNGANSRTITNSGILTVAAGGVLVTNNFGNQFANITGDSIMGAAGGDLIVMDLDDPNNGSNSKFTINSVIQDNTSPTALTKSGIGLLILGNSANTYTGKNYLNGGITRITGEGASFGSLGAVPGSPVPDNVIFTGGTLQLGAALTVNSNRGFTLADKGGTVDTNGFAGTYGGVITGTGPFTKTGLGTLRLTGANSYTGNTTINGGTLSAVNASGSATGSGNILVNSGGTLGGTGTVSGAVTLAANATAGLGGHVAPGDNGVGTLTVPSITFNNGSADEVEFASDSSYDQLNVTGLNGFTLNGGGFYLYGPPGTTSPYSPSVGNHIYGLVSFSGLIGGTGLDSSWTTPSGSNPHILNPQPGFTYSFSNSGGELTLDVNVATVIANSTWNTAANNQSWNVAGNWTPAVVPHMAGDTANFLGAATSPITVTLDAAQSVGSLNFNNTNSYTIAAGTGGSLVMDSGTASSATINDANGSHTIAAPVTLNSNTVVNVTNVGDTFTFAGNITPANSSTLTIGTGGVGTGLGTVALTATYAGNVTINSGTLQLGSATVTNAGAVTGNISDNGTLKFVRSDSYSYSGTISGSGSVVQAGTGTLTLASANTYGGGTTISSGTIKMGNATALGTGAVTINTPGILDVNGTGPTLPGIVGTGTVDNTAAGATLVTINNSSNASFTGVIQNTGGAISLDKMGTGVQTLNGVNTYTGNTMIDAGTLSINSEASLGVASNQLTINAGTLEVNTSITSARTINLANAASTIQVDSGQTYTDNNASGLTGTGLVKSGAGTMVVTNPLTLSGTVSVSNGILELQSGTSTVGSAPTIAGGTNAAPATLTLDSGASLTLPAFSIGTSGSLVGLLHINGGTFTATGTTTLTGVSNSGGGGVVTVEAGSTATFANVNFGTNDGGTFKVLGGTVSMGAVSIPRSGAVTGGASPDFSHGVIVSGGTATIASIALGTANSWGTLNVNGGSCTVTGTVTMANQATSGRGGALQVGGTGTLTLQDPAGVQMAGVNNNIAQVNVQTGGTLFAQGFVMIAADTVTGAQANINMNGGTLYVDSAGMTTHLGGGSTATVNLQSGTLAATNNWTSTADWDFGTTSTGSMFIQAADGSNNPHDITENGIVKGIAQNLVKTGGGTLTLGGANTYGSDTSVNAGTFTLAATGSLQSPNINVAPGATANIVGAINSVPTNVNDSGAVNFGANPSNAATTTTTLGSLTINANSTATVLQSPTAVFPLILSPGGFSLTDPTTSILDLKNNEVLISGSDENTVRGQIGSHEITTTVSGGVIGEKDLLNGQIEARFTLLGDSDLDGIVNVADLANLAGNFGKTSGQVWLNGDFDYNNNVNVADLADLAGNFGKDLQSQGLGAGGGAAAAAPAALSAVGGAAAVPEPTASLSLLGLAVSALGARRRRRRDWR